MGSINLSSTHAKVLGESYYLNSKLTDLFMDKDQLQFDGNRTVVVHTPEPMPLNVYQRNGANRYGDLQEVTDTIQEFTCMNDISFTGTVDAGNAKDSAAIAEAAGKRLAQQQKEALIPLLDRIAIFKLSHYGGTIVAKDDPTKSTIVEMISEGMSKVYNLAKSSENVHLLIPSKFWHLVRIAPEYNHSDNISEEMKRKGIYGTMFGATVHEIPDDYFPNNVLFVLAKKDASFAAQKLKEAQVHKNPPGISGMLLEGRVYMDAFVRGPKAGGIYVAVKSGKVLASPTISKSGTTVSITGSAPANSSYRYTTDGSDPRYSATAKVYTAAVACSSGDTFRAVTFPDIPTSGLLQPVMAAYTGGFASPVAAITV